MVAAKGEATEPLPLGNVAGNVNYVPLDHPWITNARDMGTSLGDF